MIGRDFLIRDFLLLVFVLSTDFGTLIRVDRLIRRDIFRDFFHFKLFTLRIYIRTHVKFDRLIGGDYFIRELLFLDLLVLGIYVRIWVDVDADRLVRGNLLVKVKIIYLLVENRSYQLFYIRNFIDRLIRQLHVYLLVLRFFVLLIFIHYLILYLILLFSTLFITILLILNLVPIVRRFVVLHFLHNLLPVRRFQPHRILLERVAYATEFLLDLFVQVIRVLGRQFIALLLLLFLLLFLGLSLSFQLFFIVEFGRRHLDELCRFLHGLGIIYIYLHTFAEIRLGESFAIVRPFAPLLPTPFPKSSFHEPLRLQYGVLIFLTLYVSAGSEVGFVLPVTGEMIPRLLFSVMIVTVPQRQILQRSLLGRVIFDRHLPGMLFPLVRVKIVFSQRGPLFRARNHSVLVYVNLFRATEHLPLGSKISRSIRSASLVKTLGLVPRRCGTRYLVQIIVPDLFRRDRPSCSGSIQHTCLKMSQASIRVHRGPDRGRIDS